VSKYNIWKFATSTGTCPLFQLQENNLQKNLRTIIRLRDPVSRLNFGIHPESVLTQGVTRSVSRPFYLAVSLRLALGPLPSAPCQLLPTVLTAFDRAHIDQSLHLHLTAILSGFGVGRAPCSRTTSRANAQTRVRHERSFQLPPRAAEYGGNHDGAVLGEGEREFEPTAANRL
jgi:hypothetical protein